MPLKLPVLPEEPAIDRALVGTITPATTSIDYTGRAAKEIMFPAITAPSMT